MGLFQRPPGFDSRGIAVDGRHRRAGIKNTAGITARTERAVDDQLTGTGLQCGDDFIEQDGYVARFILTARTRHHLFPV